MPVLERSGVRLNYHEEGTGGPPFVFVHGWTCDHSFFAPQIEHFGVSHRVVAPDLRGHGDSDVPDDGYSLPILAEDVAWLCVELGLSGAVIVGHSMGGAVGTQLVAQHPELASALVLVDSAVQLGPEARAMLEWAVGQLRGPGAGDLRRTAIDGMFLPSDDLAVKEYALTHMMRAPDHVALGCMQGLLDWDLESAWAAVKVPILNVYAERPLDQSGDIVSPGTRLVNVKTPGVGHFNQLLAAATVNRLIEDFLS